MNMRTSPASSALEPRRLAGVPSSTAAIGTNATAMPSKTILSAKISETAGLKTWPTVRV